MLSASVGLKAGAEPIAVPRLLAPASFRVVTRNSKGSKNGGVAGHCPNLRGSLACQWGCGTKNISLKKEAFIFSTERK
jgi:hypothetical protein